MRLLRCDPLNLINVLMVGSHKQVAETHILVCVCVSVKEECGGGGCNGDGLVFWGVEIE